MPPILPPSEQWFANKLRYLTQMVRKLMMQQSGTYARPGVVGTRPAHYTPGVNTPVMNIGQIPVSHQTQSQRYGMQTVDPQGNQRLMVGEQSDGTHGLWVYNEHGTLVLKTGQLTTNATPEYGLAAVNSSGSIIVKLDATGLSVLNAKTGLFQAVSANYETTVPGTQTYSSSTWGALSSNVSVTAVPIGPSGQASVTMSIAYLAPGSHSAGESAELGVAVDGAATPSGAHLTYSVGATDGLGSSTTFRTTITGLSSGTHDFSTLAKVSTPGVAATYTTVTLTIVPL